MKLKGFLLIAALSALLLLGQSVAVTALNNDVSMRTDAILNDKDFSVDIYFVGTGVTELARVNEVNGTYDFVSDSAITGILIKVNTTGYTTLTDLNNITAPHLFLIINGELSTVGPGVLSSAGAVISLTQGTHVISYLLIGGGNEGFQYASDTIVIRLADADDEFNDFVIADVDLDYSVTDNAVADEEWTGGSPIYYEPIWDDWARNFSYTPENNAKVWVTSEDNTTMLSDGISFDFGEEGYKILINGSIDSTGVAGLAMALDEDGIPTEQNQTTTVGHAFLVDANGVTFIGNSAPTTIGIIQLPDEGAANQAYTYLGVLAISDYGYFHDMWYGSHDVDGFSASTDGEIEYEYAFDFVASLGGVYVADAVAVDAPGFQATETAFALVTLGIVAFVIPRFRKEEK